MMDCPEAQRLLHGYVDGELDLLTSLEVERHLQECPTCAPIQARLQAVRAAIQGGSLVFTPPPDLEKRIRATVLKASPPVPVPGRRPRAWLAVAASVALALAAGGTLVFLTTRRATEAVATQELVAGHVRSQMLAGHLVDFESSDQHTVKPWFEGKLDFAPAVPDLKDQNFILVGGRLDYLDERPAAALVYRRRKHVINLFVWRSTSSADAPTQAVNRQGFHLFGWTHAGLSYWAISDLNERELREFVQLIQEKTH
jgi:anti-sigma factor RsiW